ncbi:MAG: hypothetical protein HKN36_13310 [Hellea sp.]|nr:hypothetical protein [Hellea sp.]
MSKRGPHSAVKPREKRRSKLKLLVWFLLILMIVVALALFWIWSNRYSLVENEIKSRLSEAGFQSELTISELSLSSVQIDKISLQQNGKKILTADHIVTRFNGREILDGKIMAIKVTGANIDLAVDKDGKPEVNLISSGDGGATFEFPQDGLIIQDTRVSLTSPYGKISSQIDGEIKSPTEYEGNLENVSAKLTYGDINAEISGKLNLDKQADQETKFNLSFSVPHWSYKDLTGKDAIIIGTGSTASNQIGRLVRGDFATEFESFAANSVFAKNVRLRWDGDIIAPRTVSSNIQAEGNWNIAVNDLNMPDQQMRDQIASQIVLRKTLSSAPVTENFAQPLAQIINNLLSSANVQGSGRVKKDAVRTQIFLTDRLVWENAKSRLAADSLNELPLYDYSEGETHFDLQFNADHEGRLPLIISNGHLVFETTNGRDIDGADSFNGSIKIPRNWQARTAEGDLVLLRPMSAEIQYKNEGGENDLRLKGRIQYDGDIPGGYVENLVAAGTLYLKNQDSTRLFFTPRGDEKITMDSFRTDAPWIAENISFNITPDTSKPLFSLSNRSGKLTTSVKNAEMDVINEAGTRSFHLVSDQAEINARINDGAQDWIVAARDVVMTSDNMPSRGTRMTTGSAVLTAQTRADQPLEFTIDTPRADVKTEMIDATGLAVQIAGTPASFRANYQNGQVAFAATDLPPFIMTGFADYAADTWSGEADSYLPFGQKTPLIVNYRFAGGLGSADVDIPLMKFTPSGLQPQQFIPALSGKIADVRGSASAKIKLEFSEELGMTSSGSARLIDMEMGTLPGPITGLNSELKFSSFLPLVTDSIQTMTMKSFDAGLPLADGKVTFETVPDGVKIHSARWPLGSGSVSLDPVQWIYLAPENRVVLRIENVELGEFMGEVGGDNFQATGNVNGVLPVVLSGVNVNVEDGQLKVKDGGVIRFQTDQTNAAAEVNEYAELAFDALKEFHYQELEAIMNGPLDGNIIIRLLFQGSNPEVLSGTQFKFNVKLEGELFNIARSFTMSLSDYLQRDTLESDVNSLVNEITK